MHALKTHKTLSPKVKRSKRLPQSHSKTLLLWPLLSIKMLKSNSANGTVKLCTKCQFNIRLASSVHLLKLAEKLSKSSTKSKDWSQEALLLTWKSQDSQRVLLQVLTRASRHSNKPKVLSKNLLAKPSKFQIALKVQDLNSRTSKRTWPNWTSISVSLTRLSRRELPWDKNMLTYATNQRRNSEIISPSQLPNSRDWEVSTLLMLKP